MNNYRSDIERIKQYFREQLATDAEKYKSSIIREIDFLYRSYRNQGGELTLEDFSKFALTKLNIPGGVQNLISSDLLNAEKDIASVWDKYFKSLAPFEAPDYEKMLALYQVDFPEIRKELRKAFDLAIRKAVRADYGFDTLRKMLTKKNLGEATAKTMANTGMAQFDNSYMFENAKQAGIETFYYDGVLHPNSRRFCKEQLALAREGKVYTIAEIQELDNRQGLPVLTSCGGYNCTHYWAPNVK
jgi:hypothetical protein